MRGMSEELQVFSLNCCEGKRNQDQTIPKKKVHIKAIKKINDEGKIVDLKKKKMHASNQSPTTLCRVSDSLSRWLTELSHILWKAGFSRKLTQRWRFDFRKVIGGPFGVNTWGIENRGQAVRGSADGTTFLSFVLGQVGQGFLQLYDQSLYAGHARAGVTSAVQLSSRRADSLGLSAESSPRSRG